MEYVYAEPAWNRTYGVRTFVVGMVLWSISMAHSYLRLNLWILDLVIVPLMWTCFVVGVVCIAAGLIGMRSARGAIAAVLVVPTVALVTTLIGAWWWVSPKAWFASHRALYDHALTVKLSDDYYGYLPVHLRFLTERGLVSERGRGEARFFPQWTGIPDDAGGFWHSPSGSPAGFDMYGMVCAKPVSLGGDWWMCGLRE